MAITISSNPLPAKTVLSASFHESANPPDPVPADDIPKPHEYPYLRLGILHTHRTMFFPGDVVAGPLEQTISISPGESVEVTMEFTRRVTVEEENESRSQLSTESFNEVSAQDEFTDRVSTVLQESHSTSVSANISGSIAVVSGGIGVTDTYTTTRTDSKEQMRRTLKQSTQRVSQQLMKSYVIRSKRVEDVTTRDTFRRLLRNESDAPMHFGFRKTLQLYRASTQYTGPRLIWHTAVPYPGSSLKGPRIVSPTLLPGLFLQQATRLIAVMDIGGDPVAYTIANAPVVDKIVGFRGASHFVGVRFLNGRAAIEAPVSGPGYSAKIRWSVAALAINSNYTVKLRFTPSIAAQQGALPGVLNVRIPTYQLLTIDEQIRLASDNPGETTVEDFLTTYREYLRAASDLTLRPSGDLRQEEKSVLLTSALRPFGFTKYLVYSRIGDITRFDDLFDTKSVFYSLYQPHFNSTGSNGGLADTGNFGGSGVIAEYDTFEGLPPARYGASLGWRMQLDGDSRRTEFLNSPLARVGIPIMRGREEEAVYFLLSNANYRLSATAVELMRALENRRNLERRLSDLGESDDDVPSDIITRAIDEDTAADADLAKALYPVTDVFDVTDPLAGFIYEPINV